MLKLGRIALLALAGIATLLAVLLLAVNLYVQSQGTQERIQHELSQRLGTTLRVRRMSVTPWSGLKLTGITIPQAAGAAAGDFLQAKTFRLHVELFSLFAQRLVIKEISLVNPEVFWTQNEDGRWRLPVTPTLVSAASPAPATTSVAPENSAPVSSPEPARTNEPPAAPEVVEIEKARPFTPEVRRVHLSGGRFRFLDNKARRVAEFEGVQFRSAFRNAAALRGNASIAKSSLRDRFFLEQLQSPVEYDAAVLNFSRITARAAGGRIDGRFVMEPQAQDSPFTTQINFHEIQADRVVTDAGGPAGVIRGRLEGHLDATGKTADPNALGGTGEIVLRDGVVQQFSLLVALSQLLQIDELRELRLDQAQVKFHIEPGVVKVDELLLRSPNIKVAATGAITFEGKLRLEAQLALDDKIRGRLFRAMRDNFKPTDEPGFAAIDFQVSGTIDRPKTNLMNRLVGGSLKDFGGVLNSLFGGDKPEGGRKKKRAQEEPAPSVAPDASPAASAGIVATPDPSPSEAPAVAPSP